MEQKDGKGNNDKSKEFDFGDAPKRPTLGEDVGGSKGNAVDGDAKKYTPPEPPSPDFGGGSINLAHLIGKQTLDWVKGDLEGKPQEIKQLGDDFTQKLNWYIGCTILAQYARVPSLFEALDTLSGKLFASNVVDSITDPKELVDTYTSITKEIMTVMEFARKFVVQNRDHLADNASFFDRSLFEKIKALPVDMTKDYITLFQIIETKGHELLKSILEQHK